MRVYHLNEEVNALREVGNQVSIGSERLTAMFYWETLLPGNRKDVTLR